jgi:deazaflavin-dependent oxidoreductase (nitroreductase family)
VGASLPELAVSGAPRLRTLVGLTGRISAGGLGSARAWEEERILDDTIRQALAKDRTIDITTIGRRSGLPRRIETWFFRVDDRVYLTGSPGRRDWYANLLSNPDFTFHLKQSVVADLPARATPVTDPAERKAIFARILDDLGGRRNLDAWMAGSPLMAIAFKEPDDHH